MTNTMLHVKDVAEILDLKDHSVLALIRSGRLLASNVSGGRKPVWRIRLEDLDLFLEQRQPKPPEPPLRKRGRTAGEIQFY